MAAGIVKAAQKAVKDVHAAELDSTGRWSEEGRIVCENSQRLA